MNILDSNQQAVLEAVSAGRYVGCVPFDELRADVELMLDLRLIEPSGACPYRLTAIGSRILALAIDGRPPNEMTKPNLDLGAKVHIPR